MMMKPKETKSNYHPNAAIVAGGIVYVMQSEPA